MQVDGRVATRRFAVLGFVAAAALVLSGCSMGGMFGGSNTAQQYANNNPDPATLAQVDPLPAIATECPEIKVRPGAEALFFYGTAQAGNPRNLQYQAVMDRQSRNCVVSNGLITVKMGVSGRVMLGPRGDQQQVTVPVRFDVERDSVRIFGERYEIPVPIAGETGDFVKVVENVTIPYLGGETIVIWVGFDPRG